MIKNFRSVKATLIMGILLIGVFVAFVPSSSAGIFGFFDAEPMLTISENTSDLAKQYLPAGGAFAIGIYFKFYFTAMFPGSIEALFSDRQVASIDLKVEALDEWFECTISENIITAKITKDPTDVFEKPYVRITLDERAPAFGTGRFKITATVRQQRALWATLKEKTFEKVVPFTPAYLPVINTKVESNFVEVSPGKPVYVNAYIENLGNARTAVDIVLLNIPDGWAVSGPSEVTVGAANLGESPKATVLITIQPPYGFGYHDETKSIKVQFTPRYYLGAGEGVIGETKEEVINVKNRGFSIPGFETSLVVIALISVSLILIFYRHKKR